MKTLGNTSVIERPVRITTLLSVVRSALRARQRQYLLRDYLAERKHAEEQIRQAKDAAEEANRAKDQFLAVLSHELRTPLSPVVMAIGAMLRNEALAPPVREDLEMVRRNVDLEVKLIDDLLDVSRVISGKLSLRPESLSLHDLLKRALDVCASDLQFKKLKIEVDLGAKWDRVTGDHARLQQVFWNLLKNAIKFSPEGQRLRLRTRNPTDSSVRIEVQDFGVGIPPELLPRLFNAFEQGDPSITRQFGGLGLGLAISKAVIDLHGGSITAQSAGPQAGATFTVDLNTTPLTTAPAPAPATPRPLHQRPPRVLLVEDHPDTARTLSRLLVSSGYQVSTAGTVAAALALAETERFDLLISDIGLPDATGYDLMNRLRPIKAIALSGYGMDHDVRRSRDAGFADHLTKPVNLAQLEAVIQRVAADTTENSRA